MTRPPCSDDRLSDVGEDLVHERAEESAEAVAAKNTESRYYMEAVMHLLVLFLALSMVLSLVAGIYAAVAGGNPASHMLEGTTMFVLALAASAGARLASNPDF